MDAKPLAFRAGLGDAGRKPRREPALRAAFLQEDTMAKGEQRGNREAKKPKKEKPKVSAAAASPFAKSETGAKPGSKK